MKETPDLHLFENALLILEHTRECRIPGYLVLRLKGGETSLSELSPEAARALGEALSAIVRAIEETVGADRVYCLSFAELDRRLHFHLFPRTAWLLEAYRQATGTPDAPINGPAVFEWARTTYAGDAPLPEAAGTVPEACRAIRAALAAV